MNLPESRGVDRRLSGNAREKSWSGPLRSPSLNVRAAGLLPS
jgi:hypothetical protein